MSIEGSGTRSKLWVKYASIRYYNPNYNDKRSIFTLSNSNNYIVNFYSILLLFRYIIW